MFVNWGEGMLVQKSLWVPLAVTLALVLACSSGSPSPPAPSAVAVAAESAPPPKTGDTKLDNARVLAGRGQLKLAITTVQSVLAKKPDERDAYLALGDMQLAAGILETDREKRDGLFQEAESAYGGYGSPGSEAERGLLMVKRALKLKSEGHDAKAGELAKQAWECCKTTAALPLLLKDDVVAALRAGSWQPSAWTTLPAFERQGVAARTTFVVRPPGTKALGNEQGVSDAELKAFAMAKGSVQEGGFVVFKDEINPDFSTHRGYVDHWRCPERGGCSKGPVQNTRGLALYDGPCWIVCTRGTFARPLSMEGVSSIRCEGGRSEYNGCPVSYKTTHIRTRKVPVDAVWLLPDGTDPHVDNQLKWLVDAGLSQLVEQVAQGHIAPGLPEPAIRWALADARPQYELRADAVIARYDLSGWLVVIENGLVQSAGPPSQPN